MVCPNCGFSRTVYRKNLQKGGFNPFMNMVSRYVGKKVVGLAKRGVRKVSRRINRQRGGLVNPLTMSLLKTVTNPDSVRTLGTLISVLGGNQRGAGLVGSLAKRALTSDLARDAAASLGRVLMQKIFGDKKKKRRQPNLALPAPPRKRKKKRRTAHQQGGLLPLAAALPLAALAAKTVGLGALGGAAGFGAQKLLGLGG